MALGEIVDEVQKNERDEVGWQVEGYVKGTLREMPVDVKCKRFRLGETGKEGYGTIEMASRPRGMNSPGQLMLFGSRSILGMVPGVGSSGN
jgi:hypothetical protein